MRELTMNETLTVSGAATPNEIALFIGDHLASSIIGGVAATFAGGAIGFLHGDDAMGIFGLGVIGQLVGAVGGAIIGGIGGVIGGALVPLSYSLPIVNQVAQTIVSGGIK